MRRELLFVLWGAAFLGVVSNASAQDAAPGGNAETPATPVVASETKTTSGSVFLELGGNAGSLYSLNYEGFFGDWGLRWGASVLPAGTLDDDWTFWTGTSVVSVHLGDGVHKLQLGLGVTVSYAQAPRLSDIYIQPNDRIGVAMTGVVGYRYLPTDGGLDFGAGWTPTVGYQPGVLGHVSNNALANVISLFAVGVHVGYAF